MAGINTCHMVTPADCTATISLFLTILVKTIILQNRTANGSVLYPMLGALSIAILRIKPREIPSLLTPRLRSSIESSRKITAIMAMKIAITYDIKYFAK